MRYSCVLSSLALGVCFAMSAGVPAMGQDDLLANNRLRIVPPTDDLQLATSNDISLQMTSDPVLQVFVDWKDAHGDTPDGSEEKQGLINFGPNGQAEIGVHPPVLGHLTMTIRVDFTDGRYAVATQDVDVGLPKRKPKTFVVTDDRRGDAVTCLQMDLDQNKLKRLGGVATYSGYKYPVSVEAADLKFDVKPQSSQSPIDLEPRTGFVTARSEGQALIDVRFSGQDRKVCVAVAKDASSAGCSCNSR